MNKEFVSINRYKVQFTIITAFILSLLIIVIIYDSNKQTLQAKITNAANANKPQGISTDNSALAMMESVQNLLSELKSDPNNYDLIVQAGNAFFDIGRYQQAIQYYKKAVQIQSVTELYVDMGVCYFNLGHLDSALTIMNEGIKTSPNHKQGLYNIGIVLYNLGDTDGAVLKWQQLIKAHPNTAEAIRVQQYIDEIKNVQTGT
jgi:tetratricopeptide (TPR) repeat protein